MNNKNIANSFKNKSLLITGGTGSFGKTVLSRLINYNFKEIIIFSRDERKQENLRHTFQNNRIKFVIGDVRDYNSIEDATNGVDYIFHAAALKQVPSCEFYPWEAYKTNIIGTENAINAAIKNKSKKLILLSTDKAVYPINAMGMTKAMAEKILLAKSRIEKNNKTILCITRYGNVMGSRASVIPRFINLATKNQSLPVTDSRMTRFMMSLDQSVNLVLEALLSGKNGDIFIQKSKACKINDLAKAVHIFLNKKSKINITGPRHGEKLNETLVSYEEMAFAKETKDHFVIKKDNRSINYNLYEHLGNKKRIKLNDYSSDNAEQLNIKEIVKLLKSTNADLL
jgi:UDP-N-acetylglucosamine 4,6-dehydratase/5-epimerase